MDSRDSKPLPLCVERKCDALVLESNSISVAYLSDVDVLRRSFMATMPVAIPGVESEDGMNAEQEPILEALDVKKCQSSFMPM